MSANVSSHATPSMTQWHDMMFSWQCGDVPTMVDGSDDSGEDTTLTSGWLASVMGTTACVLMLLVLVFCFGSGVFLLESDQVHIVSGAEEIDAILLPKLRSNLTVLELLQSDNLQHAVSDASVRFAKVAATLQVRSGSLPAEGLQDCNRKFARVPQLQHESRVDVHPGEQSRLRKEAVFSLQRFLKRFFDIHPKSQDVLQNIPITGEQGALMLSMF